jgi:mono/diheme cytochrome c family protein
MRYDNWWVATGQAPPIETHPLYPDIGQQAGAATWRCVECHGWDYKGADGAYASGPHYTGIGGVLGSTLTPEQQFDLIKNDHAYGDAGLADQDIWHLVEFLQNHLVEVDDYVSPDGQFFGDPNEGRFGFLAEHGYYSCAQCHGEDGAVPAGVAANDPRAFLHKVRFSDPVGVMSSTLLTGGDAMAASDIGSYLQAGLPGPSYAGDEACMNCHADFPEEGFFEGYMGTGHPWKLVHTAGQVPDQDTWPRNPPPPLPVAGGEQLEWSDVEYVIGNHFWQTRFIGRDGYLITGDADEQTQWNLYSQSWAPFFAGQDRPFACGSCHVTGYDATGHQLGLPAIAGSWEQDGVRCEACHGPSGDHVEWPVQMSPPGGRDCAECHTSDGQNRIRWKNGFLIQHVQAESLAHSPHADRMECSTCHNPHRSTVYREGGVITECTDCHPGDASNNNFQVAGMPSVGCVDCHMPKAARTSEAHGPYRGDGRAHIFQITTSPMMASENTYQEGGMTFWRTNQRGQAYVTLDYACLGCHEQIGDPLTLAEASAFATGIHARVDGPDCPADVNGDGLLDLRDIGLFVDAFLAEDPLADLVPDGLFDLQDIAAFTSSFLAGCP